MPPNNEKKVRLDKWLWAARFFKTRNLAIDAINGGKIHVDGKRFKPSREARIGQCLSIRIGMVEREVIVQGVSDQRRPACEAQLLYEETQASIEQREKQTEERKTQVHMLPRGSGRPTKKNRRLIRRFTEQPLD